MALDTLRGNKLRSGLTILGVVIGITSIVGMTSLIRGFDSSLRDMIRSLGPNTIFIGKISAVSLSSGADFATLARRPNLTIADAKAIEKLASSIETVDVWLGQGPGQNSQERVYYRGLAHWLEQRFADIGCCAVSLWRIRASFDRSDRE